MIDYVGLFFLEVVSFNANDEYCIYPASIGACSSHLLPYTVIVIYCPCSLLDREIFICYRYCVHLVPDMKGIKTTNTNDPRGFYRVHTKKVRKFLRSFPKNNFVFVQATSTYDTELERLYTQIFYMRPPRFDSTSPLVAPASGSHAPALKDILRARAAPDPVTTALDGGLSLPEAHRQAYGVSPMMVDWDEAF